MHTCVWHTLCCKLYVIYTLYVVLHGCDPNECVIPCRCVALYGCFWWGYWGWYYDFNGHNIKHKTHYTEEGSVNKYKESPWHKKLRLIFINDISMGQMLVSIRTYLIQVFQNVLSLTN